jgi:hypothetical protein
MLASLLSYAAVIRMLHSSGTALLFGEGVAGRYSGVGLLRTSLSLQNEATIPAGVVLAISSPGAIRAYFRTHERVSDSPRRTPPSEQHPFNPAIEGGRIVRPGLAAWACFGA